MSNPIKLIVGLGNPGAEYTKTRHNAGQWFIETLAEQANIHFQLEKKFQAQCARLMYAEQEVWLLIPNTFMNNSGQAVLAFAHFYKLPPQAILVAHDELDLPEGVARLKQAGGHGGHNGLRDIIARLGSADFYRLRLGIGHPGQRELVHDYVLSQPSKATRQNIQHSIDEALAVLPTVLAGHIQKAMHTLHSQ